MNPRFIKFHLPSNTYIIEKNAYFEEDLVLSGNVIVGQDVDFWKNLTVNGKLELGKGSVVKGNVKANSALVCSGVKVFGTIDVVSDLLLLDNVKVNTALSGGNVFIRPGCIADFVKAEGTLEIIGKVSIKKIEAVTKLIVRAE